MFTTRDAAIELGVSRRVAQQMAADGLLTVVTAVGDTQVLDRRSVRAARRSRGRGRRWEGRTLRAALALLDGRADDSEISSSEKSRLRAQLRHMDAQQLAYRAAGRATHHRMSQRSGSREALAAALTPTGASALTDQASAEVFDLTSVGGSWMLSGYVDDLPKVTRAFHLTDDPQGDIGVFVRRHALPTASTALTALDLYAWGDTRESTAGKSWLDHRLASL